MSSRERSEGARQLNIEQLRYKYLRGIEFSCSSTLSLFIQSLFNAISKIYNFICMGFVYILLVYS